MFATASHIDGPALRRLSDRHPLHGRPRGFASVIARRRQQEQARRDAQAERDAAAHAAAAAARRRDEFAPVIAEFVSEHHAAFVAFLTACWHDDPAGTAQRICDDLRDIDPPASATEKATRISLSQQAKTKVVWPAAAALLAVTPDPLTLLADHDPTGKLNDAAAAGQTVTSAARARRIINRARTDLLYRPRRSFSTLTDADIPRIREKIAARTVEQLGL